MDIGINYISDINDEVYRYLIKKGYINTLKFPGKFCNYDELKRFIDFSNEMGVKKDIHGLPDMVPASHSTKFIENVKWSSIKNILPICSRISTHMGLENKEKISNYKENTFEENIAKLKSQIKCDVGIENIPGGFEFDKETITPTFISDVWKKADFGVFDISHAKLAAKDLNISYDEYLEKIENKDKVRILHISGNIDKTNKYQNKPDKHILISNQEIKYVLQAIKEFSNLDLIVSEYAYNTKYTYEKEIIIEAIVLWTIINTCNAEMADNVLKRLEQDLKDDISNIEELI